MQLELEKNDCLKRLLKMPSNKLLSVFLVVLVLFFFFVYNFSSVSSTDYAAKNSECTIFASEVQSFDDVRQSNSTVSILQNFNFNRLFQLDLLFRFQLAGRFLIALTVFYAFFVASRRINSLFKFFYQIYIKSSIPCRAGPIAGKGVILLFMKHVII